MTNEELCNKFPWLCPYNVITRDLPRTYNYEYTWLNDMPEGWRKAFGLEMCEEIQKVLEKANFVDEYQVLQIKEKWGYLHWYEGGIPEKIKDEYRAIINKYEKLSERTCIKCGAPATKISCGWISPWCDKCAEECGRTTMDIDEWFKKQEEPIKDGQRVFISIRG